MTDPVANQPTVEVEVERSLGLRFWEWRMKRALRRADRIWQKIFRNGYVELFTGIPSVDKSPSSPGEMSVNPERNDS